MDVFLARQPIFDKNMNVFAYELLYRASSNNKAEFVDGDSATGSVVVNTLMLMGLEKVTGDKKAFVNFTPNTLQKELPQMFSNEYLVVEVLEDIIPDEAFIRNCTQLKEEGYLIALDDFVLTDRYDQIIDLVDIIKVDFLKTDKVERANIIQKYNHTKIKFLAEKVESKEEYLEAIEMGYVYFQGYFFSKPVVLSGSDHKSFPSTYGLVLAELYSDDPDYNKLEEIIKRDMSMSYKLLRLINSPAFASRVEIQSIKHALTMFGFKEIKKWVSLLLLREMGNDLPNELVRISLIRGKMAEVIAVKSKVSQRASEMFLVGLFSMIDILFDRRLDEIIDELPFSQDVKLAILGGNNIFRQVLNIVVYYERAQWNACVEIIESLAIDDMLVTKAYEEAIEWATEVEKNF